MPRYKSLDDVPAHILERLDHYVSNRDGDTFLVKNLPASVSGALLVRYSRAKTDLRLTLVNEFLDENGDPCIKKGEALVDRVAHDDSSQEQCTVQVGIERASQLLTKMIEDRRIGGSPIERSTRYVPYDCKDKDGRWPYFRPAELASRPKFSGLLADYERVNDRAFEVYSKAIPLLNKYFETQYPRDGFTIEVVRSGKKERVHENDLASEIEKKAFDTSYNLTIRGASLDVGRCVLPSSALSNFGLTANGKFCTHLLSFLKSQVLEEAVSRAYDLERELKKEIAPFIRRNKSNLRLQARDQEMRRIAGRILNEKTPTVRLVDLITKEDYPALIDQIVACSLFSYTNASLRQIFEAVSSMPIEEKTLIFDKYVGQRSDRRDRTGRGLESGYPLLFDVVGTFAEYRDLQRHRMLTLLRQLLTVDLGFVMPPEIGIVGIDKEVEDVVLMMGGLNEALRNKGLRDVSQYATLFNHRIRFCMGMNLREFQHLSELRTQQNCHHGYRSIVLEMAKQVNIAYPWAMSALGFIDYSDPDNKIARAREQARIAGKNIAKGVDGSIDY